MPVLPEWIDYNGHMNMAYYSVLMDHTADEAYPGLGFGPDYLERTGHTTYIADFHISYVRELHEGDRVIGSIQLLGHDEKRFHMYQELRHEEGWLAASAEALTLHIDQSGPRVAPMPPDVLEKLGAMQSAHDALPWPARAGRRLGIPKKQSDQ